MIYFRTDGNLNIASGHIIRCMSLGNAFKKKGYKVCFLCSDDNYEKLIRGKGFEFINLNVDYRNLTTEIDFLINRIKFDCELLILDTYFVYDKYIKILSKYVRVCYLGSKKVDLSYLYAIINYNYVLHDEYYKYGNCIKLLGYKYAPLRSEFENSNYKLRNKIESILITTGGTDNINFTGSILKELLFRQYKFKINAIIGDNFIYRNMLKDDYSEKVNLIESPTLVSSVMKKCDLAITANGTTVYELAAIGVPIISFCLSSEQLISARKMSELGMSIYCGEAYIDIDKVIKNICTSIDEMIVNEEIRYKISYTAHEQIDGNGCNNIINDLKF